MLYSSLAYAGRGALLGLAVMLAGLPLLAIARSRQTVSRAVFSYRLQRCAMGPLMVLLALFLSVAPSGLLAQDSSGPARTPDVHFVPTAMEVVQAMLSTAKVGKGDMVYDLGCGDGRIVITAIKKYGARGGVCVDIDPVRIKESRNNADTAGVASKMKFVNGDLFQTDLSPASVVTLYLLPMLNVRLRPKLFRELKPGTRVVSNSFDMGDWKADSTMSVKNEGGFSSYAYYWMIPADVAGTWKVSGAPGGGYTVRLEQQYQQVKGTAEGNDGAGDHRGGRLGQGRQPRIYAS